MYNNFNVLSAWGWETNPCANPDTANNGGGYSQPAGGCVLEVNGCLLCVVDIDAPAASMRWACCVGSMADASISDPEEVDAIAASVWGVVGIELDELIRVALNAAHVCAAYARKE